MEGAQFDSLTHALISSRRGNVKALLGGAFGMLLAGRAGEQVLAGCKKVGKRCDKNKDCCDGAKCKGGKNGKCKCKSGFDDCNGDGTCEPVTNDVNCGACVPVTPPFSPFAGFCSSDQECCDNALCCTFDDADGPVSICIDVLTHTTACGLSCDSLVNCFNTNQVCVNGECVDE